MMKTNLPGGVLRRIRAVARRLDRVYCGGFGNDLDALTYRLLAVALAALRDYDDGRRA